MVREPQQFDDCDERVHQSATSTIWNYLIHSVQTNYYYLTLTQNTNLTTTPIKFAPTPFVPANFFSTNYNFGNFESATAGVYAPPSLVNGWNVLVAR
ncbi:MAG: hypothetical protein WDN00_03805 [Limisphaerales bacterium]